jgi:hypothetical protein
MALSFKDGAVKRPVRLASLPKPSMYMVLLAMAILTNSLTHYILRIRMQEAHFSLLILVVAG